MDGMATLLLLLLLLLLLPLLLPPLPRCDRSQYGLIWGGTAADWGDEQQGVTNPSGINNFGWPTGSATYPPVMMDPIFSTAASASLPVYLLGLRICLGRSLWLWVSMDLSLSQH
jgi:hypothetical protein